MRAGAWIIVLGAISAGACGAGGSPTQHVHSRTVVDVRAEQMPDVRADIDPLLAAPALFRAINQARATRGVPALHIDSTLSVVARRALARYLAAVAGSEQRVAAAANSELRAVSLLYEGVFSQVLYVGALDDAPAALQHVTEPRMACVGIAVERLRDSHDPSRPTGLGVVVILGENGSGAWYASGQQP